MFDNGNLKLLLLFYLYRMELKTDPCHIEKVQREGLAVMCVVTSP